MLSATTPLSLKLRILVLRLPAIVGDIDGKHTDCINPAITFLGRLYRKMRHRKTVVANRGYSPIFEIMKLQLVITIGIVLSSAPLVSSPASGQEMVETAILSKKTKDIGDIFDKAWKKANGEKPQVESPAPRPKASMGHARAATGGARTPVAPAKPRVLPETFSSETEDPASILDITVDVMTRFTVALAAEVAKREASNNLLTHENFDAVGAQAGGFTPRQYFVLKARLRPFCDAVAAGQMPPNDLKLSYMPTEAMAIRPRCAALLPTLKGIPAK